MLSYYQKPLSRSPSSYIFLDRDGVLNLDCGYTHKTSDLILLPDVVPALKLLSAHDYRFCIITNQAGIARSIFTLEDANSFNFQLCSLLYSFGVTIDAVYLCPHHPDFTGACDCRKPANGLINEAKSTLLVDIPSSWLVGDKLSDIIAGHQSCIKSILVETGEGLTQPLSSLYSYRASNMIEAAHYILSQ